MWPCKMSTKKEKILKLVFYWDAFDEKHFVFILHHDCDTLMHYAIAELHASLTHGLWGYENWGYPVLDAFPGAEM